MASELAAFQAVATTYSLTKAQAATYFVAVILSTDPTSLGLSTTPNPGNPGGLSDQQTYINQFNAATNRAIVSGNFANQSATAASLNYPVVGPTTNAGFIGAVNSELGVSNLTSTVVVAEGQISVAAVANNPALITGQSDPGSTFTLTTGVDTVTGNVNTIYGVGITNAGANGGTGTTLNVYDTINPSSANSGLILNTGGAAISFGTADTPTLTNVKTLTSNSQSGAITWAGALLPNLVTNNIGASSANNSTFTITSNAPATLTHLSYTNMTGTGDNTSITYKAGAHLGTSDALSIALDGLFSGTSDSPAAAADIVVAHTATTEGFETVNITNVGGRSSIGTLTVASTGGTSTYSKLNISNTGTDTLKIWGTLDFKDTAGTIDASSSTSGVDVQVGTEDITFKGGSGNDSLRFANAGDLTAADSVDMGGGSFNTLWLADTALGGSGTATLNGLVNAITTAQIIGMGANATYDMSGITAKNVTIGASVDATIQKISATDTIWVQAVTAGNANFTAALGYNTVNLNLAGDAYAVAAIGTVNVTNQSSFNIVSSGVAGVGANTMGAVTNSANTVVTLTGANDFTVTSFSNSVAFNGADFTGKITATGSNTASSFTGGIGNDTFTGGTGADTFVGGDGKDQINTGADGAVTTVITGGLKADAINLQATSAAAHVTTLNTTAAESFATSGQFDTVTFSDGTAVGSNTVTLTSGVLSSTVTAATSVSIGSTVVTAGSFLWVNTAGSAGPTNQNASLYQDSNSNGLIDAADLQINFVVGGTDTLEVTTVGGKAVITDNFV